MCAPLTLPVRLPSGTRECQDSPSIKVCFCACVCLAHALLAAQTPAPDRATGRGALSTHPASLLTNSSSPLPARRLNFEEDRHDTDPVPATSDSPLSLGELHVDDEDDTALEPAFAVLSDSRDGSGYRPDAQCVVLCGSLVSGA